MDLDQELKLFQEGYKVVGGIDEAGRGPLAGPVVAACVVVDHETLKHIQSSPFLLKRVNDSKKLNEKKREILFDIIMEEFPEIGIGICDNETIDRINILQASFLAMKKAISSLKKKPDYALIDGKFIIPNSSLFQKPIIGGDSLVFTIAAASIIAKVSRDRIMYEMHGKYPEYDFAKHKGYGTKLHMKMLAEHGPCKIHRTSNEPVRRILNSNIKILNPK